MSVTWFDRQAVLEELHEAVRQSAQRRPEIRRVLMFGSLAAGGTAPGSDADLLIILEGADRPFPDRMPHYLPAVRQVAVDVFAYTEAELDGMLREGNCFVKRALAEGIELDLGL